MKSFCLQILIIFLCAFCFAEVIAQSKMVQLSNFDPSKYKINCGCPDIPSSGPWCYSDIWGYTSTANGREYAILAVTGSNLGGPNQGAAFIDITDPLNPVEVGFIASPASTHRDIKTFADYAYIATDAGGMGIQIVDLSQLPAGVSEVATSPWTLIDRAHNLFVDEPNAKLYVAGANTGSFSQCNANGFFVADLATNPELPVFLDVQCDRYSHDVFVRDNIVVSAAPGPLEFRIIEFDDHTNTLIPLVEIDYDQAAPGQAPHDQWMTEDGNYLVTGAERTGNDAIFWDISDLNNIQETDRFPAKKGARQHNHLIKGNDRCYIAHYTLGLSVLDISDKYNVQEISYFDTYAKNDHPLYQGAWGAYPFLPSGNILVSDMNNGLFVLNDCVPLASQSPDPDLILEKEQIQNEVRGWAATKTIHVQPNYPTDQFEIGLDGNTSLIAGEKIVLHPGFEVRGGGKFHAQIGPMCTECGEPADPGCLDQNQEAEGESRSGIREENQALSGIRVFPNPSEGVFQIELSLDEWATIEVTDLLGSLILKEEGGPSFTIDLSNELKGVYLLTLQQGNAVFSEKLIVQ